MQLVWSSSFARSLKRLQRQRPQLKPSIAQTLDQLERDPFHPSLHTHKLKGSLADRYACSINYADRIIFRFVQNPVSDEEEIFLLAIGSYDEVY